MRKLNRATNSLHKHLAANISKADGALKLSEIRVPKGKLTRGKDRNTILIMATTQKGTSFPAVEKKLGLKREGVEKVLENLRKRNGLIVTMAGEDRFRVKVPRNSTAKWREFAKAKASA